MAKVLILFAHPGQRHSRVNVAMARMARDLPGITFVDLYADYPRYEIDIDAEQARLLAHDIIVLQFPIYWYSTPSMLKEWQDLVLEYGFAYGHDGDKLRGKLFFPVLTTGGPQDAYSEKGRNHFPLRTLLSPLEQTANLCQMRFIPPLALFSAHSAADGRHVADHVATYRALLEAMRDDRFDIDAALAAELLNDTNLPIRGSAQ